MASLIERQVVARVVQKHRPAAKRSNHHKTRVTMQARNSHFPGRESVITNAEQSERRFASVDAAPSSFKFFKVRLEVAPCARGALGDGCRVVSNAALSHDHEALR